MVLCCSSYPNNRSVETKVLSLLPPIIIKAIVWQPVTIRTTEPIYDANECNYSYIFRLRTINVKDVGTILIPNTGGEGSGCTGS